jgi:hypothetical protein
VRGVRKQRSAMCGGSAGPAPHAQRPRLRSSHPTIMCPQGRREQIPTEPDGLAAPCFRRTQFRDDSLEADEQPRCTRRTHTQAATATGSGVCSSSQWVSPRRVFMCRDARGTSRRSRASRCRCRRPTSSCR